MGLTKSLAGVGVGVGLVRLVKESSQLEQSFSQTMRTIQASTGATGAEVKSLTDLAMRMGAETKFSANDSAEAMLELAKAGIATKDIMGGALSGTLLLAAAGSTDLGTASTIASNAMNTFNLSGKDMASIASALAGGANASSASVESLGQALQQVGPGATNAGLSLQETVGVLSAFDAAGIKGSDAGTSLKTMLTRLVPSTRAAREEMMNLGLDFTNADGSFRDITDVAQQLQDKLGPLSEAQRTQALQTIFGSDATRAATVLTKEGAKGLAAYIRATKDQEAAQKMADAAMAGTSGALERLGGSVETAKLALGQALAPTIVEVADYLSEKAVPAVTDFIEGMRTGKGAGGQLADDLKLVVGVGKDVVGVARDVYGAFSDLPGPVKEYGLKAAVAAVGVKKLVDAAKGLRGITSLAGLAGGKGLAAGALGAAAGRGKGGVVPVFVTNPGFDGPGKGRGGTTVAGGTGGGNGSGKRGGSMLAAGGAIAGAGAAISFGVELLGGKGVVSELGDVRDSLDRTRDAGKGMSRSFEDVRGSLEKSNVGAYAQDLGLDLDKLAKDIVRNGDSGEYLNQTMKDLSDQGLKGAAAGLADFITPGWDSKVKLAGRAVDDLGRISGAAAEQLRSGGGAAAYLMVGVNAITPSMRAYQRVLRGMPKAVVTKVEQLGAEISRRDVQRLKRQYDLTPRQVRTLMGLIGDGPTRKKLAAVRAQMAVTDALKAFPFIGQKGAEKTRGDVARVFSGVQTLGRARATPRIAQQGAGDALSQMAAVGRGLASLNGRTATTYIRTIRTSTGGSGNRMAFVADGGYIQGPGGPRDDQIDARVSNGEFIVNAAATKRNRALLEQINGGGRPKFRDTVRAYADGGYVGSSLGSRLEILEAQKEIADMQRELNERRKKKVGKGKKAHTVNAGYKLQGLDREIAAERLRIAQQELEVMKTGATRPDTRSLQDSVRQAMSGGIFDAGTTTAAGLLRQLQQRQVNNQAWATMIAGLTSAGLSKPLLNELIAKGPSMATLKLGQDILRSGLAGQLNGATGTLTTQGNAAAAYAGGVAKSPVAPVQIENFYAQQQTPAEIGERVYFLSRVRS